MNRIAAGAAALVAAFGLPAAAQAQDVFSNAEVIGGGSLGAYTNTGDSSIILGGFVQSDWRVARNLFAGGEVNAHIGVGEVDADFSVLGRFGYRFNSGAKLFVRGGYHLTELGRTRDNFLVGAGVEVPAGGVVVRGIIDRPGFGSTRLTTGVGWRF
ncbi:MAG: hypothetical protein ACXIT4_07775 [Erythrobacter sp.]